MIHIEDKLKRTNVYIKRDNVEVNYLTQKEFEAEIDKANAKIKGIYSRINAYATEEDFNKEVEKINDEIETINSIIADSNEAYQNGYNEGVKEQKNKLTSISITENGTYTNENGYNEVMVNVEMLPTDGGYDKGFADGEQATKDKMLAIQITENGIYEDTNGYKSVKVSVKQDVGNVDFSLIGYDSEENGNAIDKINEDIAYSRTLYDAWDSSKTSAEEYFMSNSELVYCPKIDTSKVTKMRNMFRVCESLTTIPQLNTSNVKDMSNMFYYCPTLKTIPLLETSNVTDMNYMFYECRTLTSIPQLDTSNVTRMDFMFFGCKSLKTIPQLNTSNVKNVRSMFNSCTSLTTIPSLDTSNVTEMGGMFYDCTSLTSIPLLDCSNVTSIDNLFGNYDINTLTDLGGFKNLKVTWEYWEGLYKLPNLTHQSILNVINHLYDFRSNGSSITRTLQIHPNAMAMLTDEDKALATNKGWVLTS